MSWARRQSWAANLIGIALSFLTLIAFTSLPEVTMEHLLSMRKFMVKNDVRGSSIFSPVLGAVSCKKDVALGWPLLSLSCLDWTQYLIYGHLSLWHSLLLSCTLLCLVTTEKWYHFSLYILKMDCNDGCYSFLMNCWNRFFCVHIALQS